MKDKKSFVLYCDLIHTVEKMPNEKAGELFKHILSYVNDQNPSTEDLVIQLTFEPIKQQLKRDLEKWESIRVKRSEAGKKSAEKRQHKSTSVESVKQDSANPTVNGNVTVNVNDNVINTFLTWFNSQKKKHTGTAGRFKALGKTDLNNLKQIKDKYTQEDMVYATARLFDSKGWPMNNNMATPSHLLRLENFNKLLNQPEPSNYKANY